MINIAEWIENITPEMMQQVLLVFMYLAFLGFILMLILWIINLILGDDNGILQASLMMFCFAIIIIFFQDIYGRF